jgi:uncharacterized protein (DUF1330 family)
MSAYVVGNYSIHNVELYMQYVSQVRETIEAFNGITLTADHEHQTFEGQPGQVVTIVKFDSEELARKWYNSAAYSKIIPLRQRASEGWVTLCSALEIQESTEGEQ